MVPEQVKGWLIEQGYGEVKQVQPVGGGCINHGARLHTMGGASFFLKTNHHTPADMFEREAEGLLALSISGGPRLPRPYLAGPNFLLLEDLTPAPRQAGYWPDFGRQLAGLHSHTSDRFGFSHDNYIGSTPQPNPWTADGWQFFASHRLGFQGQLAYRSGLLDRADLARLDKLSGRLAQLVPAQPASLIHGDLWSGNAMTGPEGEPALIDPAAHYGWAEAELAMTSLFGSFPDTFYRSYEEARPLDPGYRQRFDLYNLYHLLNHLNLFGGGYRGEVLAILRRYG